MFDQINSIDSVAVKLYQIKSLMEILLECDDIPEKSKNNILHIAFDVITEQERTLIQVSKSLIGKNSK